MSFFKRLKHYLDPRTAFKSFVGLHKSAIDFTKREAKKDYIRSSRVASKSAKIVTPILAAVASFIPIFGVILGPILAGLGALISRFASAVTLRQHGVKGLENRQLSRNQERRTFKFGLIGAAIGSFISGILSVIGVGASAATTAATGSEAASAGAPVASVDIPSTVESIPYEGATENASTLAGGVKPVVQPAIETASQTGAPGIVDVTESPSLQVGTGEVVQTSPEQAVQTSLQQPGLKTSVAVGGGNFLTDAGKFLANLGPSILKALGGKGSTQGAPAGGSPGAGGGGEPGGPSGDTGGLLDSISGLPLPVKLAAGALGAGILFFGLRGNRKAA